MILRNDVLRKGFVFGIILLCVITSIVSVLNAVPLSISTSTKLDSWLYVGGSGPGNYTTIQSAINAANPRDAIFVYHGVYLETVVIDKALSLNGENRTSTIINGMYTNSELTMTSDDISCSGFTIINSGGFQNNAAITLQSNNISISNCILYRSRIGIRIHNATFTTIHNCILHTNGNGVKAEHSSCITIDASEVCYSGIGINLYYPDCN